MSTETPTAITKGPTKSTLSVVFEIYHCILLVEGSVTQTQLKGGVLLRPETAHARTRPAAEPRRLPSSAPSRPRRPPGTRGVKGPGSRPGRPATGQSRLAATRHAGEHLDAAERGRDGSDFQTVLRGPLHVQGLVFSTRDVTASGAGPGWRGGGPGPRRHGFPSGYGAPGFSSSTAAGEHTARASQAEATGVSRAAPSGAPGAFRRRRPREARLSEFFPSGFTTRAKTRRSRPTGIGPRGPRDRGRPCLGRRVLFVHSYRADLRNPPDSTVRPGLAPLCVEFMQETSASGPEGGCGEPRAFSADRSGRRHRIGGDATTTDGKTSDVLRMPCNGCRCVI